MHRLFFSAVLITILGVGGYWYAAQPTYDMKAGVKAPPEPTKSIFEGGSVPVIEIGKSNANNNLDTQKAPSKSNIIQNSNQQKIMNATLHTNKGDIVLEFSNATPNTVANFLKLAEAKFYNGVKFHRVIKGFMIQGGDPLTKDDNNVSKWGTGGPGYSFKDEIGPENKNDIGTVAMANAGPDTNGSQFFINVANNNFLDKKHTVFARVIKGAEVVKGIEMVKTGESDRPLDPLVIESITLQ